MQELERKPINGVHTHKRDQGSCVHAHYMAKAGCESSAWMRCSDSCRGGVQRTFAEVISDEESFQNLCCQHSPGSSLAQYHGRGT
eukprot:403351-Pelagomonas_calceolata.AAC.6